MIGAHLEAATTERPHSHERPPRMRFTWLGGGRKGVAPRERPLPDPFRCPGEMQPASTFEYTHNSYMIMF